DPAPALAAFRGWVTRPWMDHVCVKLFPPYTPRTAKGKKAGGTMKYGQPKGSAPRLYFPWPTLIAVLTTDAPLFAVEGQKKALAVAQLGLPAVGFQGVEGWH